MSRYIDADPLCEEMKKRQDSAHKWYVEAHAKADEETMVYADSAMAAFIECRLTIESQPTADVAPVVHGIWKRISPAKIYECSECGKNVMTDDIEAYTFCHGCGAKMDGGEE